ncbi:hypothetical protein [Halomonas kalidii]|uniref:hypothetical protein n=1 Tax=Halomonas kalidii TaxID=3043293 RepID=UPI0024A8B4CD|nr:hypothetical protein [Halomonas kalidii]
MEHSTRKIKVEEIYLSASFLQNLIFKIASMVASGPANRFTSNACNVWTPAGSAMFLLSSLASRTIVAMPLPAVLRSSATEDAVVSFGV